MFNVRVPVRIRYSNYKWITTTDSPSFVIGYE